MNSANNHAKCSRKKEEKRIRVEVTVMNRREAKIRYGSEADTERKKRKP